MQRHYITLGSHASFDTHLFLIHNTPLFQLLTMPQGCDSFISEPFSSKSCDFLYWVIWDNWVYSIKAVVISFPRKESSANGNDRQIVFCIKIRHININPISIWNHSKYIIIFYVHDDDTYCCFCCFDFYPWEVAHCLAIVYQWNTFLLRLNVTCLCCFGDIAIRLWSSVDVFTPITDGWSPAEDVNITARAELF